MNSAAVLLPGFVGTELPEWLASRLRAGLAGVCLFGENIRSRQQLRELTDSIRAANPRALIAIDEEGGDVTRLYYAEGSPYPGNALLGRINDLELTAEVAATVARELRSVGVNLNFAPDADINSSPDNPVIGVRSFGDDAELVSTHVNAWVGAHEAEGVAVSAKHFPGHGDTTQDSHHDLPAIDVPAAELRDRELRPFLAAVQAGARSIMSSHIVVRAIDPNAPATFSEPILGGLLRGELDFDGVIVSDALDMTGASGQIGIPAAAGADTLPVFEGDRLPQLDGQLIVVGKDNHRHAWTREFIDTLRVERPTAIIIDMGWPSADRAYADVATFGASRFAGEALVTWLERESS